MRMEWTRASNLSRWRASANMRAARIGPTVCELDGPIPILKRSKTLIAMPRIFREWVVLCHCNGAALRSGHRRAIHREACAQRLGLAAHALHGGCVPDMVEKIANPAGQRRHRGSADAPRGSRGRADANSARDERRLRIVRHRILVHCDVRGT